MIVPKLEAGMILRSFLRQVLVLTALPLAAFSAPILYGGNGGHNNGDSVNDGFLVIVNSISAAVAPIGHPADVARLSGLAFDLDGSLFASTVGAGGFPPPPGPMGTSSLLQLNPDTGAIINSSAIHLASGVSISIADLAIQPGTGTLFAMRNGQDELGGQGNLYTVDKATGLATLVGATGDFFGSIAFAPDGTLYMASADLNFSNGSMFNVGLKTLNPTNAAQLSFTPTANFYGALAVRPTDSVIFATNGDGGSLFTLNPTTGAGTRLGSTGNNFVGDLDFRPLPEPGTLTLFAAGALALWGARSRCSRRPK